MKVMTSEILLSKDLIEVKACNNHRVSVLKPSLFVYTNGTSLTECKNGRQQIILLSLC